jgi:hypothetical protein
VSHGGSGGIAESLRRRRAEEALAVIKRTSKGAGGKSRTHFKPNAHLDFGGVWLNRLRRKFARGQERFSEGVVKIVAALKIGGRIRLSFS